VTFVAKSVTVIVSLSDEDLASEVVTVAGFESYVYHVFVFSPLPVYRRGL
jgi:hypothetical protein